MYTTIEEESERHSPNRSMLHVSHSFWSKAKSDPFARVASMSSPSAASLSPSSLLAALTILFMQSCNATLSVSKPFKRMAISFMSLIAVSCLDRRNIPAVFRSFSLNGRFTNKSSSAAASLEKDATLLAACTLTTSSHLSHALQ